MLDVESQVLAGLEVLEAEDIDLVVWTNLVVVGGVNEGQSKHALLLQVGFVDTGKAADDDGETAEEAGLEGGVLTR